MAYGIANLPLQELISPLAAASSALARLDERLSRSPLRDGCIARQHFADACASLWIDGELVHLEDLVFHDAGFGIRTPTHELTVAVDVLRVRRRIAAHPPDWALSPNGLRSLRGRGSASDAIAPETKSASPPDIEAIPPGEEGDDPLREHLAAIDAVLARTAALLARSTGSGISATPTPARQRERDPLVYEDDWNEDERLQEWQAAAEQLENLPPVLRAVLMLDAWNSVQVLQHAPWLGRLLAAAFLRQSGLAQAHLPSLNLGLKLIPRERRTSRNRTVRLIALLKALEAAAEAGLKEHDRLLLAQQQMQRRLVGKRQSSKLPQLIDLVLSFPMVSTGMIAEALKITPQGALKLAGELNLRELTGRGRFRAWGVL
jgi:hypothetical protein